ncbi:MAG: transglutaminase domain-containing protein [Chitinophagaceae bacterium]|nr:transglutaminase domain-containing protein [Chitinophagaceae bacterium]
MMQVIKKISVLRFLAQVLFILLPTSLIALFITWNTSHYFTMLKEQWMSQAIFFSSGLLISYFIYQFRFRFLPLFLLLVFALYSGYAILDNYAVGEFDSFFISIQFLVFAYLFSFGWICGWGLKRVSFFPIILSAILLMISLVLISKTKEITVGQMLQSLTPIALYGVYIIYTNEALRNTEKTNGRFWWRFSSRLVLFCSLLLLLFGAVVFIMYPQIKERIADYGGQGKEGDNSMLKNNQDGTVENKESMGLNGNNKRNSNPEPLFCAHIENYFPGTDIPNPLYLTSFHFTKFDTLTETFERDSLIKFNDEFIPDPSRIPLFFTYKDSTRLRNSFGFRKRSTIEIEVYKKRLSSKAFISPSTGFFVQPITVEKDFQKEFTSAYRAKSYVSELNSAYFVYNTDDPNIRGFQEQRFNELRKAPGYANMDKAFMDYYTFFPSDPKYSPIKSLADSISQGKTKVIDKVIGVRDYFLQKNALGEQVYAYSDNPGIPGLPGASKLMYFLFESKKGYCAYYAAATVFILRAMKIPSRVVTGFLTVDRSDKNKGWYWFYEDQSHGWVQIYFPEYGWIDFDTTVSNEEAEQSPTPDGTPPMQPPKPLMAASGKIISVDTLKKLSVMRMNNLIFKDVEYSSISLDLNMDLRVANVWKDSIKMPIAALKKGDDVMCVSYAEKLKAYSAEKTADLLVRKLPSPAPIDEIYIKDLSKEKEKEADKTKAEEKPVTWYLKHTLFIALSIFLGLFAIPAIVYLYYRLRIKTSNVNHRAYYTYKAATFLLNQLQVNRQNLTLYRFAHQSVDPRFHTQFGRFMNIYLKLKYAGQSLNADESKFVEQFYPPFQQSVRKSFGLFTRIKRFFNLNQFIQYYFLPEPESKS